MRNDRMVVTLWEDRAEEFMQLLSKAKDLPLCVVITGLLAKKFSGHVFTSLDGQLQHSQGRLFHYAKKPFFKASKFY